MKALLIGNKYPKLDNVSFAQLYPFFQYRQRLRQDLNLEFRHIQADTFAEIEAACRDVRGIDVFFIRPTWRDTPSHAQQFFQRLRQRYPTQTIVLIDPWDQTTGKFLGVLPYVDRLIKYQRLKDLSQYHQPLAGGTVLTDYLVRQQGYDIGVWNVGSAVPEGYEQRIMTGWNLATIPRFQRDLYMRQFWPFRSRVRDIDIFCRVSYGTLKKLDWYGLYRKAGIETLMTLESDYRLAVSGEYEETRVISSRQYFQEIRRARIAFSPFGWGETTWRDYEAVCYGCLLVKPCVDHVDVKPNIFIAGQTYVPVQWDFSDLADKCRYYLEHWDEAEEIIKNARSAYLDYFKQGEFIQIIREAILEDQPHYASAKIFATTQSA